MDGQTSLNQPVSFDLINAWEQFPWHPCCNGIGERFKQYYFHRHIQYLHK
jgi:hypothetical protein